MKPIFYLFLLSLSLISCDSIMHNTSVGESHTTNEGEFYQWRTYTFDTDEQMAMTEQYLEKALLPTLKRLNMRSIGVFKKRPEVEDSAKQIMVLIPFNSMNQMVTLEEKLLEDKKYLSEGSAFLNTPYTHPLFKRIEITVLKAFVDMPAMKVPKLQGDRKDRIYEMRSYESISQAYYVNKVDMFNAGGEVKLFDRLGFNAVFYGEVIAGSKMPNLMYMTTFTDQASRDAHWKAFVDSPEWKELIAMDKYKNNVSKADLYFLYPTEYSDY
jgi:hypothetical protein